MNIHSESDDLQISIFNEFFLIADKIRKARRNARQGFGKFKCKSNPSGGGAQFPAPTSNKDPLPRQCKDLAMLPLRQALPSREAHSAKKGKTRSKQRRTRPLLATRWDVNSQTRTRKRSWQGAMEDRAKVTPNGHLRRSPTGTSRREPQQAWSRWLVDLLSPRYFQSNPFLFLTFQNPFLQLLGKDRIRRTWAPPPQGKWRKKISQPPEQRNQTRLARQEGNWPPPQWLFPTRLWSHTQVADQEQPPPRGRTSKVSQP